MESLFICAIAPLKVILYHTITKTNYIVILLFGTHTVYCHVYDTILTYRQQFEEYIVNNIRDIRLFHDDIGSHQGVFVHSSRSNGGIISGTSEVVGRRRDWLIHSIYRLNHTTTGRGHHWLRTWISPYVPWDAMSFSKLWDICFESKTWTLYHLCNYHAVGNTVLYLIVLLRDLTVGNIVIL